jgi:hypothetical protein
MDVQSRAKYFGLKRPLNRGAVIVVREHDENESLLRGNQEE